MNQNEVWSFVHNLKPDHFAEGLKNSDELVRRLVAQRIGVVRDVSQVNNLIGSLALELSKDVRNEIVDALGRIGEPAIPPLMRGLTDENAYMRRASAKALGGIGCVGAIGNICTATGDQNPFVRSVAVAALGDIGILNAEVEAKILVCLDDDDEKVVVSAAFTSGDLGCTAAVPRLISLLDEGSPRFKMVIIENLGEIGDSRATEKLCQMLVKNDGTGGTGFSINTTKISEHIIPALGKIADPQAIQYLIKTLIYCVTFDEDTGQCDTGEEYTETRNDEHECPTSDILVRVHSALTQIGEPAIPRLIETLKEWAVIDECKEDSRGCSCCTPTVTSEICFFLSEFGPSAIDPVLKLLRDENVSVRKIAADFFSWEHLDENRVLDALIDCLTTDPDEKVRMLVSSRLGDGGQKGFLAITGIVEQLDRPFTGAEMRAVREICYESLSNLAQGLEDPDEKKRSETLNALREMIKSSPELSNTDRLAAYQRRAVNL